MDLQICLEKLQRVGVLNFAAVAEKEQEKWIDRIFGEQPYLANVYPGDTRKIGIVFAIRTARKNISIWGYIPFSGNPIPWAARRYRQRAIG